MQHRADLLARSAGLGVGVEMGPCVELWSWGVGGEVVWGLVWRCGVGGGVEWGLVWSCGVGGGVEWVEGWSGWRGGVGGGVEWVEWGLAQCRAVEILGTPQAGVGSRWSIDTERRRNGEQPGCGEFQWSQCMCPFYQGKTAGPCVAMKHHTACVRCAAVPSTYRVC